MIRRWFLTVPVVAAMPAMAQRRQTADTLNKALPKAENEREERILAVIRNMAEQGGTYLSVPIDDGKWLSILTESVNAQTVVEVGTSTGFSGLFFARALVNTGGKLITHEIDEGRFRQAGENFQKAGVSSQVTQVPGNARETLKRIRGPVDVVFLDADKDGYIPYFETLLLHVRPGGLILAHNTPMVPEYLERVKNTRSLETVIYGEGGGLSVTLKKRGA